MKKIIVLFLLVICAGVSFGQATGYSLKGTSADQIIDARSIALGESFAANPVSPYSFVYNPANLSKINDIRLFYNKRLVDWMGDDNSDFYYSSCGLVLPTPIGNFALSYSKFTADFEEINQYYYTKSSLKNSTFALAYSKEIIKNFSAGGTLKFFNMNGEGDSGDRYFKTETSDAVNMFADLGVLYNIDLPFIKADDRIKDRLFFGASIQNIGADINIKNTDNLSVVESGFELAQYFRLGFSYGITVTSPTQENILNFIISGEYKNQTNPQDNEKTTVDNFGIGMETQIFNVFSLRIGGLIKNDDNLFYRRGEMKINYGLGINLPVKCLFDNLPLNISFDYAVISLSNTSKNLSSFNLNIKYEASIF